jgi:hypothetical protein
MTCHPGYIELNDFRIQKSIFNYILFKNNLKIKINPFILLNNPKNKWKN